MTSEQRAQVVADAVDAALNAAGLHLATGGECLPLEGPEREVALQAIAVEVCKVVGEGEWP